jgi:hypothetical protein
VDLFRLCDAVVVRVNSQDQRGEDRVFVVDQTVSVSPIFRPVVDGQGQKAVGMIRAWLRCEVTEQLFVPPGGVLE